MKPPKPLQEPAFTAGLSPEEEARFDEHVMSQSTPESMALAEAIFSMRAHVASGTAPLVLTVRCSRPFQGGVCRLPVAHIWDVGGDLELHYFRGARQTHPELRVDLLDEALAHQEAGMPTVARREVEELADAEATEFDECLEFPRHPKGWLLFGCRRHGNAIVTASLLLEKAKKARKDIAFAFGAEPSTSRLS
ncbi:hypothetical protein G3R41_08815 [Modestobacter muralis]|uniref:Uncharacterized protein n=1 Tax=Modestobacter muralis TaxID=1608614 RepID=A0A6P0H5G7_9ACTN|nr:hypothetical protein [Modestobacter muralis]NEN51040.1 hypothetical protein [Modestobacter muralis]